MSLRATHVLAFFAVLAAGGAVGIEARRRAARRLVPSARSTSAPNAAPPPDVKGLVRAEVFDGFPAWVSRYEGSVPTMYQDVKGLVTCGVGNLIDPMERALALPWLREDGTPATQDEIRAEWQRVKALPSAMVAAKYRAPGALHLSEEGIAQLVNRQNAANVAQLARTFPDLPSFPAPVQTALLGMAWAMGAGFPARWPTFTEAVRAHDWKAAAERSHIKDGTEARNKAHAELFLSAVGMS